MPSSRETFNVGGVLLNQPFKIRRLGHFGFNLSNMEDGVRFYVDLLGFRISDVMDYSRRAKDPSQVAGLGDPNGYFTRYGNDHHAMVLFIPVDPAERSTVKIVVDGVAILFWLKQSASGDVLPMPLDTNWIGWVTLATVAVWLLITQRMRVRIKEDRDEMKAAPSREIACERSPINAPAPRNSVKELLDG